MSGIITERLPCAMCESLDIIEYQILPDGTRIWIKEPSFSTYQFTDEKSSEVKRFNICPICERNILAVVENYLENKK